ncbi:TRAP transporter large permease [Lentibacter algarum]|uniref:TRAP transporter large permease n=1 Tax=Lentibacter algarum TaxID=576131 RepID=UPI002090B304|nr:TRAP transporter large permease subunit [Lentibacter algarum]
MIWVSLGIGGCLLVFLAAGVWVAIALLVTSAIALLFFSGTQVGANLALQSWGAANSWSLAALPLFIWMGEILLRSRISEDLFEGLSPLLSRLPGGLVHVGILGSGIFAAISGSSAATAATIGKVTIPRLLERGYNEKLVIGVVAGSGTLGLLIPPSIILIVYGVATEQSISRLFAAGILPGILLMGLFMCYVGIHTTLFPAYTKQARTAEKVEWKASLRLIPIVLIIGSIFGVIYTGWASPTDAAAVGVFFSLIFAIASDRHEGRTSIAPYIEGLMGAVRTSAMIVLIYIGASFLTVSMGYTGIPRELALWINTLDLTPAQLLIALTIFFAIAGCFLDGVSIVLLTTAVMVPMVQQAGFDLIWFGIYLVIVVEMSQITPPVGFNLFVMQGLTGKDIIYLSKAALPFFMLMLLAVVLIYVFPQIVTFLPNSMN